MRIDMMNDVLTPVVVGAADIGAGYWDEKRLATNPAAFKFRPLVGIVAAFGGYALQMLDIQAKTAQVVAHAGMPLAVRGIYEWVKTATGTPVARAAQAAAPRMARQPVSAGVGRYPAPARETEFSQVRLD